MFTKLAHYYLLAILNLSKPSLDLNTHTNILTGAELILIRI
jgi:hypothetical protein